MSDLTPEWGDVPYDHRMPEQIIEDYVVVRGDLSEQYARDQLATQWRRHMAAARAEGADEVKRQVEAQIRHLLAVPADVTTVDRSAMATDLRLNVLEP